MAKFDKTTLEQILKNAEAGEYGLDEFVPRSNDLISDSITANNLQERALGKLLLDQYKGRVPNKKTSLTELRDFAEGLREQYLPDVKSKIEVPMKLESSTGLYRPKSDLIQIAAKQSPEDFASALAHEGLHGRDYKAGDYGDLYKVNPGIDTNIRLRDLPGAADFITEKGKVLDPSSMKDLLKNADIDDIKEAMLKGHHGLKRGATIAKANLPRLLKGLPLLSAGAVLLHCDPAEAAKETVLQGVESSSPFLLSKLGASAAAPHVGMGLAAAQAFLPEEAGNAEEDRLLRVEDKARKAYAKSPARMNRLQKLLRPQK